jgi:hypothetical protein
MEWKSRKRECQPGYWFAYLVRRRFSLEASVPPPPAREILSRAAPAMDVCLPERIPATSNVTAANQTARFKPWDLNGREKKIKNQGYSSEYLFLRRCSLEATVPAPRAFETIAFAAAVMDRNSPLAIPLRISSTSSRSSLSNDPEP